MCGLFNQKSTKNSENENYSIKKKINYKCKYFIYRSVVRSKPKKYSNFLSSFQQNFHSYNNLYKFQNFYFISINEILKYKCNTYIY